MNGSQSVKITDLTDSDLEILSVDELLCTAHNLLKSAKILEKDVEGYKNDSERLRRERNDLRNELEEVKKSAEVMEADRDRLNEELHDVKNELKDLKREGTRRNLIITKTPLSTSSTTDPVFCTPTTSIPVNKRPLKLSPVSSSTTSSSEEGALHRAKRSRMPKFDADIDTPYRTQMSQSTIECLPPPPPPVLTFTNFVPPSFSTPSSSQSGNSLSGMNGTPQNKALDRTPHSSSSNYSHNNYDRQRRWGDHQGNQNNHTQQGQYGNRGRGRNQGNYQNQNQNRNTGPPLLCGRHPEQSSLSREKALQIADLIRPLTESQLDMDKLKGNTKYHKCYCKPCNVTTLDSPDLVVRHIFQHSHLDKIYYKNYAVSQDDFDYWKKALENSQKGSF